LQQQILRHLDGIDDYAVRTHERRTGFWRSSYVRIAEPYCMLADLAPADGPGQVALRAWPGLAARHMLLDVIGCVLTNRCPVDLLLLTADEGRADDCSPNCCRPKAD
jgi:hypothetical protein